MSDDDNGAEQYEVDGSVDGVSLSVSGPDPEEVERLFDEKLADLVEERIDEPDHHHVEAGAGWLMANASAESPEEAMAIWLDMWERMIQDVKDLSDEERTQAGLKDSL